MANPATETPPRDQTTGKFTPKAPEAPPAGGAPKEPAAAKPGSEKAKAEQTGLRTFFEQHMHKKPKDEAPEVKEPEPKPKEPTKPKPAPRRAVPLSSPSVQEIGKAVGDAVREAIKPTVEKKDEPKEEPLPAEAENILSVLKEMASENPTKYKDLPAKFAAGQRELNKYSAQWEKDNPGQEFDIESPEHAEFVEKHNPDWNDTEYSKAERSLLKKEVREEVTKEITPKLTAIEQREQMRLAEPVIQGEAAKAAQDFWGSLPDGYKGVFNPDGTVNDEVLKKIEAEDKDGYEAIMQQASDLNLEIVELRKLFPMKDGVPALAKFDPANPIHTAIDNFGVELERDILANTNKLNADGQEFLPNDKYNALPKDQRKNYWTMSYPYVKEALVLDRAERVKKALKDMEERILRGAKRLNLVPGAQPSAGVTRQPNVRPGPAPRDTREEKPNGPSSAPASRMAATLRSSADQGKTAGASFLNHAFRRSS